MLLVWAHLTPLTNIMVWLTAVICIHPFWWRDDEVKVCNPHTTLLFKCFSAQYSHHYLVNGILKGNNSCANNICNSHCFRFRFISVGIRFIVINCCLPNKPKMASSRHLWRSNRMQQQFSKNNQSQVTPSWKFQPIVLVFWVANENCAQLVHQLDTVTSFSQQTTNSRQKKQTRKEIWNRERKRISVVWLHVFFSSSRKEFKQIKQLACSFHIWIVF